MRAMLIAVGATLVGGQAVAEIPQFRASCPTGIFAAGAGGRVFINGKKANVKEIGANSFTAKHGGIEIDFVFDGSEPSVSYTRRGGSNGICRVTQFRAASDSGSQASGVLDSDKMKAECRRFASEKFGVRPSYVQVDRVVRDHGMYSIYGDADRKNFICTFTSDGRFVAVDRTVGSGEGGGGGRERGLQGIAGMRSVDAINAMSSRGFKDVDSFTFGSAQNGIFYNRSTRVCAQLTMTDGKVVDAKQIPSHRKCR